MGTIETEGWEEDWGIYFFPPLWRCGPDRLWDANAHDRPAAFSIFLKLLRWLLYSADDDDESGIDLPI